MRDHRLDWRDGVPVSTRFEDPFYSLTDGLAETRHVFLEGNDLPDLFRHGFHIAELGFGTGLNLLATWEAFEQFGVPGRLGFISFEGFPLSASDASAALDQFPSLAAKADALLDVWQAVVAGEPVELGPIDLRVVPGDARDTLKHQNIEVDAWFLDGFAPERNPEMWEPDLLGEVGRTTKAGGTCATYSAAGHIRRSLEASGFEITRVPGFGRKRHMTKGVKS